MNLFKTTMKREHSSQIMVGLLFIVYLVLGLRIPGPIAVAVDTTLGKVLIVIAALSLFAYANPILAVLGLFVAHDLIRRSSNQTGSTALSMYVPTEEKKESQMQAMNHFPYTLEQEMVNKMTVSHESIIPDSPSNYKPVLDDLHNASSL